MPAGRGGGAQCLSLTVINARESRLPTACLSATRGHRKATQQETHPLELGSWGAWRPCRHCARLGELTFLGAANKHLRANILEYLQQVRQCSKLKP